MFCVFDVRVSDVRRVVRLVSKLIASLYDRRASKLRMSVEKLGFKPYGWVAKLISFYETVRDILMAEDNALKMVYARFASI